MPLVGVLESADWRSSVASKKIECAIIMSEGQPLTSTTCAFEYFTDAYIDKLFSLWITFFLSSFFVRLLLDTSCISYEHLR